MNKLSRADLIADGVAAQVYHTEAASAEYAVVKLRLLTATHHMRGSSGAVGAWALSQFGEDVETEGLSWGELDYGIHQWRRRATSFAPTFGQLLGVIQKGKSQAGGPGLAFSKGYQTRIKRVLGMEEAKADKPAPRRPAENILRRRLGPLRLAHVLSGVVKTIADWEAEKAQGGRARGHDEWQDWSEISEIMLKGERRVAEKLRARVAAFEAGHDPYDSNPYFDGVPQEAEPREGHYG